jgi:hypothetical protein
MKCGLKRLGRSSLGQQDGVAIQHLLPNQESLSQCSQAVSRIDTDDKQKVRNTLAFACMPAEPLMTSRKLETQAAFACMPAEP